MKTTDINQILKNHPYTRGQFLGTFPCDRIPSKPTPYTCFVSNTDPHYLPGQHWVAFYVDHEGKVFYFDPYGIPPINRYHLNFLNRTHWSYNCKQLQSNYSETCGYLCVNFLIESCRLQSPHQTLRNVLNLPTNFTDRILNRRREVYHK